MSRAGRPTKPTALKLVSGTARKGRLNAEEPKPQVVAPDPPAYLDAIAAGEWRRIVQELAAVGVMSNLDTVALAAYCTAFSRWREAEDALALFRAQDPKAKGLVIKTIQGNLIQNPLVGMSNQAMAAMVRYGSEFGLTPASRARVKGDAGDASDPTARFFD